MNIQILERTDCKGRQTVVTLRFMCIGRTERKVKNNCKDRPKKITCALNKIKTLLNLVLIEILRQPKKTNFSSFFFFFQFHFSFFIFDLLRVS